ncbi:MAG: PEP-CTERM sorting domain-containing protein [Phenylobacterium sp.]|nr:PEP-CTERM sorting domain-containing protein [Phenylobacterium sp.]
MITIAGHSKEFDSAVVFSSGHLDSQTYFQADINTTMGEYFTDQAKSDCEAWDGCFDYFGFADVQGTFFGGQMPVSAFLDTEFETDLLSSSSAPNVEARIVLVDNLGFPGSNGTLFLIPDHFEVRAVPEPATWALMLAGFGGIGAVLRTRRRQPPEGVA